MFILNLFTQHKRVIVPQLTPVKQQRAHVHEQRHRDMLDRFRREEEDVRKSQPGSNALRLVEALRQANAKDGGKVVNVGPTEAAEFLAICESPSV